MNAPLRIGLVGAGAIAQSHVQGIRDSDRVVLTAVTDLRRDAALAVAEDMGCQVFDSHLELADSGVCDAAIICTPPCTHADLGIDLLTRGLHVLCEKPLCLSPERARDLVAVARANDVVFTMASKFRYVEDLVRTKSAIESGILGDIVLFENTFTARVDMTQRWNSDPRVSGGGVLIDNGTHSFDIMRYLFGPISEVLAIEGKRVQYMPVEDSARIAVRTDSGIMGSIDLSWSYHKDTESFVDIFGSQGVLRVGWRESRYRQVSSPDWVVFGSGYDKVDAMRRQIENFCGAIRGEEDLLIGPEDAIASVEVVQAAYQSLNRNDWIPVASSSVTDRANLGAA